jgi:flagellar basal-body rod protein FlgF/flagellar basal-body rod protein FlgG
MNSGFYSAYAGFAARMDELDLVANNLANVSTTGFKAQRDFYQSFSAWLQPSTTSPLNQAVNQFGLLGGSRIDLSQGNIEPTGNDTDIALQGPGFVAVLTQNGVRYTRDGSFRLDKDRYLVTAQGDRVLSEQPNNRNQPIQLPSGKLAISPDASVSVDGNLIAKLRIEDFPAGTKLTQEGASYLVAPAGAGAPAVKSAVQQGSLESSNSDAVRTTVELINLQRTSQMMERALSIFHNEFNKSAASDLPRV